jgi:hypothetical protein
MLVLISLKGCDYSSFCPISIFFRAPDPFLRSMQTQGDICNDIMQCYGGHATSIL